MISKWSKRLSLLLAGLMLVGSLVACGENSDNPAGGAQGTGNGQSDTSAATEAETDPAKAALEALGEIDYGGKEFGILYYTGCKNEIEAVNGQVDNEGGNSQVINDAVYKRNSMLEDLCKLKLSYVDMADVAGLNSKVQIEATAPTGDFKMVDTYIYMNAELATGNYLFDLVDLGVDLEGPWWDSGTADFVLDGGVYFMTGSLNIEDDNRTYILLFNKEMRKAYANTVANPYETVRSREWTLDYFNEMIQGISKENGDGKWDHLDTYGFVTTHEYGTTFFIGSGMSYITGEEGEPTLTLADAGRMEQAINVVNLSRKIYHDNHVTYMAPGWEEAKSYTAFLEDRAMFYGETCMWIDNVSAEMKSDYGVLPIPKYDKKQELYRTWTHASGSSFSVTKSVSEEEKETVGKIFEAYAILSHQYLQPAFYDVKLTKQNVVDSDSVEMMELLFSNRVYDMAFYFDFGFSNLVHDCVNNNTDTFSSGYSRAAKVFDRKLDRLLSNMRKDN